MNVFNNLERQYNELHANVEALRQGLPEGKEKIEESVAGLASIINTNESALERSIEDHAKLYQLIVNDLETLNSPDLRGLINTVKGIQYQWTLYNLNRVSKEPKLLAEWLNERPNADIINESDFRSNPGKVLKAFADARQKSVNFPNKFQESFDRMLSNTAVISLGLNDLKFVHSLDQEVRMMAYGHFINEFQKPLSEFKFSIQTLKLVAPYLIDVNCLGVKFKDDQEAQEFVQSCSNAYSLIIDSDKITALRPSSSKLVYLNCNRCCSLRELSVSHLSSLESLHCIDCRDLQDLTLSRLKSLRGAIFAECTILRKVSLSNLPSLEFIDYTHCPNLSALALSDLPSLRGVRGAHCTSLATLSLSKLPSLEELYLMYCHSLKELTLNNFQKLKIVDFSYCNVLSSCTLSNLPELKVVGCNDCLSLENIVSNGLPSCEHVNRHNCPKLTGLPTLAEGAKVFS